MNRRGESRACPGPPRWRRQVPGAPFLQPRPPCGVRPAPPLQSASRRESGRCAPKPRPPRPPVLRGDAPPLARTASRAPRAPCPGPLPLPPARPLRPAPAPFRPLASPALAGGRSGPLPRARFLLTPTPAPCSCPAASPAFSLPAVRVAPASRVLTPPAWPGQPGTPRPHVSGPVTPTLHFCAVAGKNGREFGLLLRKHSSAKIPRLRFSLYVCLAWTVIKNCKDFD